jgi:uncharacterized membrane-anchored protein YjiN (DUF445 family)
MPSPSSAVPVPGPDADDGARAGALRAARLRATGLLVVVAALFLGSLALPDSTGAGYLTAALEAGLVGGLADWFAVVALFRHPLGLPIPHTAVVPRSKDGFGRNLGRFVGDNFLASERVAAELADPARVGRVGAWLAVPANARRVAAGGLGVVAALARTVDRDLVVAEATTVARRRLADLPAAELTGRAVDGALTRGTHVAVVTAVVEGVLAGVEANRATLRRELGRHSPAWVPAALDDLVFDRANDVVTAVLRDVVARPDHPLRRVVDEQLALLAGRLRSDDDLAGRVDDAVDTALSEALVARWVGAAWDSVVAALERSGSVPGTPPGTALVPAADGDDDLLRVASDALRGFGAGLAPGAVHHDRVVAVLAAAAPGVAEVAGREVVGLVTRTVDAWDPDDTATRLELWLGPELQWVRVNGTLVGAGVGLVLHAVTQAV